MSVKDSGSTAGRGVGSGVGRGVGRVAGRGVGAGAVISDGRAYVGGGAGGSPADIARGGTGNAVTLDVSTAAHSEIRMGTVLPSTVGTGRSDGSLPYKTSQLSSSGPRYPILYHPITLMADSILLNTKYATCVPG